MNAMLYWYRCLMRCFILLSIAWIACASLSASASVEYVVFINIDGLNAGAIPALGQAGAPNLWRMRTEGAFTDNARTDYDRTNTTPGHSTILTGRPVVAPNGHLWGSNDPYPLLLAPSIHHAHNFSGSPIKPAYEYVSSVFDVVHDHGLRTALYHQKDRLQLFEVSYNAVYGAPDVVGADNGRNKIDSIQQRWLGRLVSEWLTAMRANPFQFSYVHFALTDSAGHEYGFSLTPGSAYMAAVQETDGWVGQILALIESDARFSGKTLVSHDNGSRWHIGRHNAPSGAYYR